MKKIFTQKMLSINKMISKDKFLNFLDTLAMEEGQINVHFIVLPYSDRETVFQLAKTSPNLENVNHHTLQPIGVRTEGI